MKNLNYLFILCIALLSNLLYAQVPVYTEDKKNIIVTATQPKFIIQLKSNPTTGYSWLLRRYDAKFVKVVDHKYLPAPTKLMGAPQVEQWFFELTKAGLSMPERTKIDFIYARPWEPKGFEQQLIFTVGGKGTSSSA